MLGAGDRRRCYLRVASSKTPKRKIFSFLRAGCFFTVGSVAALAEAALRCENLSDLVGGKKWLWRGYPSAIYGGGPCAQLFCENSCPVRCGVLGNGEASSGTSRARGRRRSGSFGRQERKARRSHEGAPVSGKFARAAARRARSAAKSRVIATELSLHGCEQLFLPAGRVFAPGDPARPVSGYAIPPRGRGENLHGENLAPQISRPCDASFRCLYHRGGCLGQQGARSRRWRARSHYRKRTG